MSTGLYDHKEIKTTNQYRSDGDTIPYVAVAQDVTDAVGVGDIVEVSNGLQFIGVVQSIRSAGSMELKPTVTAVGDLLDLRVEGIVAAKMAAADVAVGATVAWTTATPRSDATMGSSATGAHMMIQAFDNAGGQLYGLVRINVAPKAVV